jgi:uncharacterized RDD family membrane protein YckC
MQTIEIRTTQNVTIEYELASLRERFFAIFIDSLIVGSFYFILLMILSNTIGSALFEYPALVSLTLIGMFIFYQLFSEILADGQSWGKKAMGIKVVRLDGKEPGLSDYLLRAVFHMVDSVVSLGIMAALMISSSNKNQRLGDMTANTTVIRIKFNLRFQLEDILKINTLEDYEPTYQEVRRLNEKDMLLIKTIISRYRKYRNNAHQEVIDELVENLVHHLSNSH